MWTDSPPSVEEELRQGDLLVDLPLPKHKSLVLTPGGLTAPVVIGAAVVLDHCCTLEQKHAVTLGRVISTSPLKPGDRFLAALESLDPTPGADYARYQHLLAPHAAIPAKSQKRKVIDLLEVVHLRFENTEETGWLRQKRVGRMTAVSRAHLRQKLAVLWGRPEDGDRDLLAAEGLDEFGRPQPKVYHGFPG